MSQIHPCASPIVGVYYTDTLEKKRAEQLAESLDLPIITDSSGYDFVLGFFHENLTLSMTCNPSRAGKIYVEFVKGPAGFRRRQGRKEMLIKAVGFRKNQPLTILDATGGMGKDSFLMASYGCSVHMLERNRIVAALLEDGLRRASEDPVTRVIAGRIQISNMDSHQFLQDVIGLEKKYDVIYLDPMYPKRTKSALVKKEMQMLQRLIGYETDTEQLFTAALSVARKRVVVKRPKTAPSLADHTPSHSLSGKTTRFDVYMIPD